MSKRTTPTADDLRLAAEWLDVNEGSDGESETCHLVADWLRAAAGREELRTVIERIAAGVKVNYHLTSPAIRKRIRQTALTALERRA